LLPVRRSMQSAYRTLPAAPTAAQRPHQGETARKKVLTTTPAKDGSNAMLNRSPNGTVGTHCRTGTSGLTRSRRLAAKSHIRRPRHDGQKPRPMQDNATRRLSRQPSQATRMNPWARIPHLRNASTSSTAKRGRPDSPGFRLGQKRAPLLGEQSIEDGLLRPMAGGRMRFQPARRARLGHSRARQFQPPRVIRRAKVFGSPHAGRPTTA
jgi:hypothetical protein